MPIYRLTEEIIFPPVHHAESGILAVGGDLSVERLLLAYQSGIFPWYSKEEPIIWWAPEERCVLFPDDLKVSKSMKQLIKRKAFEVTFDQAFETVIQACAKSKREGQPGTWITAEMEEAYIELHQQGWAHSVEVWQDNQLVGGLYGVAIGSIYFGESMFFKVSNASKYGFIMLVDFLKGNNFQLIDCQLETPHLMSLGATLIDRNAYMELLHKALIKVP